MFGMGAQEILIILAVALIFIGPKKLPEIAKTLGKGYRDLRRAADDLKGQIDLESVTEGYDYESDDEGEDEHDDTSGGVPSADEQTHPTEDLSPDKLEELNPTHEQNETTVDPEKTKD